MSDNQAHLQDDDFEIPRLRTLQGDWVVRAGAAKMNDARRRVGLGGGLAQGL